MLARMAIAGTPQEVAYRVKAALAFKGIKLTEKGARNSVGGIGQSTVSRIASPTDNSRTADEKELEALAKATGVPFDFLLSGFASMEAPLTDIERRMVALESALEERLANVELLLARQLAADAGPDDLGDAARLLRGLAQRLQDRLPRSNESGTGAVGGSSL